MLLYSIGSPEMIVSYDDPKGAMQGFTVVVII